MNNTQYTHISLDALKEDYLVSSENDDDSIRALKESISKLPATDQLIFLIYADNQSMSKTAKLLNVSTSTVFNVIHRIRNDIGMKLFDVIPVNSNKD